MSSAKITSLGATQAKETIYIDIDDEITSVIDRVTASKAKIVALVLPKRATVMQSIVNMKLLKRTADEAGKNVVLVTSEAGLIPLAGIVGLHVAATPTSKPSIPEPPKMSSDEPEKVDEPLDVVDGTAGTDDEFDPAAAAAVPVGALAGNDPDAILMADDDAGDAEVASDDKTAKPKATAPLNKKLKIPSFNKFRMGIVLGVVALILLITGWVFAAVVLPKAAIAITTDSSTVNSDLSLTLDTTASTLNTENNTLPAAAESINKTDTEEVATTGQVNNGQKATGSVVFSTTRCAPNLTPKPDAIPVGSSVTSNNHTYITQEKATYGALVLTSGSCGYYESNSVDIIALKAGTEYNLGANSTFTGAGSGKGSASGGTDQITKVVSQADIDNAKQKIAAKDTTQLVEDLKSELEGRDLVAVDSTFLAGEPQITTNLNVGDKADSVKVTAATAYTMLGVKRADLEKVLRQTLDDKVDTKKQTIADDGLDKIRFSQQNVGSPTAAIVLAKVKTVIGPKLDTEALRKQVAGSKSGDIKTLLQDIPGVTEVEVAFSPFWVTNAPSNTQKITIIIDGETR